MTEQTLQPPVSAYFDPQILQAERQSLFGQARSGYVGHELMVPEPGDYQTLASEADARVLVRDGQQVKLLSNVCRHRQAIIMRGKGQVQNIVCPLHRWTYDLSGQLIGAPHFDPQPSAHLDATPLQNWRGLLFDSERDVATELSGLGLDTIFNFDGYVLNHIEMHECQYNWKTFIEVYLEDYHVAPFHPGLGQFVDCNDLQWTFGDRFSVQTVGLHKGLRNPGTETYRRWHEQVLARHGTTLPAYGAVWMTYYPNLMLEWYPDVLVISNLIPTGAQSTLNVVEFYYPQDIALFEPEFIQAERDAYMETAVEDDEIAIRMEAGRQALMHRSLNQTGPYQSPMEDGMAHFHRYLREHNLYPD